MTNSRSCKSGSLLKMFMTRKRVKPQFIPSADESTTALEIIYKLCIGEH